MNSSRSVRTVPAIRAGSTAIIVSSILFSQQAPELSDNQLKIRFNDAVEHIASETDQAIESFQRGRFDSARRQLAAVQQHLHELDSLAGAFKSKPALESVVGDNEDNLAGIYTQSGYYEGLIKLYVDQDYPEAVRHFSEIVDNIQQTNKEMRGTLLTSFATQFVFPLAKAQFSAHDYDSCLHSLTLETGSIWKAIANDMDVSYDEMANRRELSFLSDQSDLDFAITLNAETSHISNLALNKQVTYFVSSLLINRKPFVFDLIGQQLLRIRNSGAKAREVHEQLEIVRAQADRLDPLRSLRSKLNPTGRSKPGVEELEKREQQIEQTLSSLIESGAGVNDSSLARMLSHLPTTTQIAQLLSDGQEIIQYVKYRPYNSKANSQNKQSIWAASEYAAYVIRPDGSVAFFPLGSAVVIDGIVQRIRIGLGATAPRGSYSLSASADLTPQLRALEQLVLEPLLPHGLHSSWKQLYVVPDGTLNLVPFAALVRTSGRFVIQDGPVSYLTSPKELLRTQSAAKPGRALLMANPAFGTRSIATSPKYGRLPSGFSLFFDSASIANSEDEIDSVGRLLRDPILLKREDASEHNLKEIASPVIVHIASHGFVIPRMPASGSFSANVKNLGINKKSDDGVQLQGMNAFAMEIDSGNPWFRRIATGGLVEDPLLHSGIALEGANSRKGSQGEDGILTAREAIGLDLRGTELFVLSACNTGVGPATAEESLYGFRRALVLAGARNTVLSLWEVQDVAAHDMMIYFYQRLSLGDTPAQALRFVQIMFLSRSPSIWASLFVSGVDERLSAKAFSITAHQ